MKLLTKHLLSLTLIVGLASAAMAQPGWNWGDSVDKAKEKNALYTDFLRSGNFQKALVPLNWLLKNTPDLNESIYINGIKIYEGLVETETDPAKSLALKEKTLNMYDLRIKYFDGEKDVMNRKALSAYKFYKGEQKKYPELKALFDKSFAINGNDFYSSNLTAYMDVIRRYKLTGGDITDEEVFAIYSTLTDVIDYQMKNGGNQSRLEKTAEYVDKLLTSTVEVDCNFVEEKLGPKFKETGDVKLAKKIFSLMLTQKCTDSPLALDAAIAINENEPNFAIAKFIGSKSAQDGDKEKATEYYNRAIELTDDNTKKSEIYLSLARIQSSNGDKVSSRGSARRALAFDPSYLDAYKLIGDLYMTSFDDCKGGQSKVLDRGIFIAAYDMYEKAGNRESMAAAKAQFPSIEEIFSENYEEGQVIKVDCWINQSVKIERRPSN
ncbi:MAG: hypothetical protein RIA69_07760 [Cyclobacteriaceae bacterium]